MPANILGWFNVKDYGAIGNGIANDTTHVQAAIDAVTPPGGIVYFPQGSFVTNGVSTTNDAAVPIYFVGCGVGITTLFANTAFDDAVIRLQRPGGFEGMTVDAGGLAKYAIAVTSATSIPLANVLLRDVRCTASHKTGGPCLYFSAIAPSFLPLFGEVTFDRVIVDRSASLDGGAVIANVGTLFVQNFTTTDCIGPGPNFFIIERLFMNGAYAANNPQDSGLTIDQFVKEAHVSNLAVDVSCSDGVVMAAQKLYLTNSNIQATTFLNQPDSANPQYVETCNCDFAAIAIQGPPPLGFKIVGGNVAAPAGNAAAINFTQSVGSILSNVVIVGATFDNAAIPAWIRSVHPITLTNSVISRNIVKGTSSVTNIRSSVGVDLNAADFALSTGAPGLDNTIALQRAINACLNLGGGVVRVPHSSGADYDLAGYVSIPPGSPAITLRGEAPGTVFVQTKANEPVIAIGDRTTLAGTTGVRVENLSVKSTAASGSTGPGIQITNSTKVYLDRVEFANLDTGVDVYKVTGLYMNECNGTINADGGGAGIVLDGPSTEDPAGQANEVHVVDCVFSPSKGTPVNATGIAIYSAQGVKVSHCDIRNFAPDLRIAPGYDASNKLTQAVYNTEFLDTSFDNIPPGGPDIIIKPTGEDDKWGMVYNVTFRDCNISGSTLSGVLVSAEGSGRGLYQYNPFLRLQRL